MNAYAQLEQKLTLCSRVVERMRAILVPPYFRESYDEDLRAFDKKIEEIRRVAVGEKSMECEEAEFRTLVNWSPMFDALCLKATHDSRATDERKATPTQREFLRHHDIIDCANEWDLELREPVAALLAQCLTEKTKRQFSLRMDQRGNVTPPPRR